MPLDVSRPPARPCERRSDSLLTFERLRGPLSWTAGRRDPFDYIDRFGAPVFAKDMRVRVESHRWRVAELLGELDDGGALLADQEQGESVAQVVRAWATEARLRCGRVELAASPGRATRRAPAALARSAGRIRHAPPRALDGSRRGRHAVRHCRSRGGSCARSSGRSRPPRRRSGTPRRATDRRWAGRTRADRPSPEEGGARQVAPRRDDPVPNQ